MANNYYQKHKEKLRKESKSFEEKKTKGEKRPLKDIKI